MLNLQTSHKSKIFSGRGKYKTTSIFVRNSKLLTTELNFFSYKQLQICNTLEHITRRKKGGMSAYSVDLSRLREK